MTRTQRACQACRRVFIVPRYNADTPYYRLTFCLACDDEDNDYATTRADLVEMWRDHTRAP